MAIQGAQREIEADTRQIQEPNTSLTKGQRDGRGAEGSGGVVATERNCDGKQRVPAATTRGTSDTGPTTEEEQLLDLVKKVQETLHKDVTPTAWGFFQSAMGLLPGYMKKQQEAAKKAETLQKSAAYAGRAGGAIQTGGTSCAGNTWATVASAQTIGQQLQQWPLPSQAAPTVADARKSRQVVVRISNEEQKKLMVGTPLSQLTQVLQGLGGAATSIIATQKTRGGDILLDTASVEAKEELERDNGWIKEVHSSARILHKTYQVAVHGARIGAVDTKSQKGAIESLKEANKKLHPDLEIAAVEWPGFAYRTKDNGSQKQSSTLIVETTKPEVANRLIDNSLVLEGALLSCERWDRKVDPTQCFNCQAYGHKAPSCKRPVRCGACSMSHNSREHIVQVGQRPSCAVCSGGHEAWSEDCPTRKKERAKREKSMGQKSKYYPVPLRQPKPQVNRASPPTFMAGGQKDTDGFQMVGHKKRRVMMNDITTEATNTTMKRGRPSTAITLGRAERNQQPIFGTLRLAAPARVQDVQDVQDIQGVQDAQARGISAPPTKAQEVQGVQDVQNEIEMQDENQPPSTQ